MAEPLEDIELQPLDGRHVYVTNGRWFGRIRVVSIWGKDCYIGPHWPFTIGLFAIMFLMVFIFYLVVLQLSWFHLPLGTLLIALTFASYFKLLASDPGVLGLPSATKALPFDGLEQLFPSSGGRDCAICNITQPNGSLHCEYCQVCVEGYDHHCPWTSKCIGKNNMVDFQLFLGLGVATMLYIVFATALHGASAQHVH